MDVNKPSTIYVTFPPLGAPRTFNVYDANGKLYYFRYLDGKTYRIKFNIPDPGHYTANVPINIVKIVDVEIPDKYPTLPPAVRDRWKDTTLVYNPDMDSQTSTPIRIYTATGVIEYGDKFLTYPKPIQVFLIEHEKGHFFYVDEEACDMFGLLNFVRKGYSQSQAYYAMLHILNRSRENVSRIYALFNNIQKLRS